MVGRARSDSPPFLDFNDAAHHILRHAIWVHSRDALRLEQLLQELPVALLHLLNQVVDVGAVTFVQRFELFIEEVKFISLLERRGEHVHCHMKVESLVNLLILIVAGQLSLAFFVIILETKTTIVIIILL